MTMHPSNKKADNSKSRVLELFSRYGLQFNKALGQHFMLDKNIIRKIAEFAAVSERDYVLEIGAGAGTLTNELVTRARGVVAVEIDRGLVKLLEDEFCEQKAKLEIVHTDVLKHDLGALITRRFPEATSMKIVANLPYSITSPVLLNSTKTSLPLELMVLMIQQEVADRLRAAPRSRDYGILGIMMQYHFKIEKLMRISSKSFVPPPDVSSALVRLTPIMLDPEAKHIGSVMLDVLHASFSARRKMLRNTLLASGLWGLSPDLIAAAFTRLGLSPKLRPEQITVMEYAGLTRELVLMRDLMEPGREAIS